jgi:hypothetical protein
LFHITTFRVQLVVLVVVTSVSGVDELDSPVGIVLVSCSQPEHFDSDVLQTFRRKYGFPKALKIGASASGG